MREEERGVLLTRLKEHREKQFLTQAALAAKARLSEPTIVRLENGKTGARFSTVLRLAEALGVKPEELTG